MLEAEATGEDSSLHRQGSPPTPAPFWAEQDQKADIILKYDGDEARSLKAYNELPETVQINAGTEALDGEEFGDDNFDFDEDADNDSDEGIGKDDVDDI